MATSIDRDKLPALNTNPDFTYPSATAAEVVAFLLEHDLTEAEIKKKVIPHFGKRANNYKAITSKVALKEIPFLMSHHPAKDILKAKLDKMDFSRKGGGGGGRDPVSREKYISQSEKMGFSNNAAGFVSFNAAKIFNITEGTKLNRNGDSVQAFETRNFSCSIDLQKREITLKLISK